MKTVYTAALERAALLLGGVERLSQYLGVRPSQLQRWLAGDSAPPTRVFLRVVDVVSQESLDRLGDASNDSGVDSQMGRYAQVQALAGSRAARVRLLRESIEQGAMPMHQTPSVSEFLSREFGVREAGLVLQVALDSTIAATGAQFGSMQLLEADGLHLVVQHGFKPPFLDFFARVKGEESTCGVAMQTRTRIVVEDVAAHPIYRGKASGNVMLEANARAVQSTPLISASGDVLGVFSTHYDHPHTLHGNDFSVIDHIGTRTTYWLDRALDAMEI